LLVLRPEWKRPLKMPRNEWKDNIKIDLEETGHGMDSSGL
jgi:hypothetical protein